MSNGFTHITSKIEASLKDVSSVLDSALNKVNYNELSTEDKIRYDLFLAYALNSLLWVYLRMNAEDPTQSIIRTELTRIKELMSELQLIIDRKTIMPRLDQGAAKRFVKHGLWQPNDEDAPKRKHIRFSE